MLSPRRGRAASQLDAFIAVATAGAEGAPGPEPSPQQAGAAAVAEQAGGEHPSVGRRLLVSLINSSHSPSRGPSPNPNRRCLALP